MRLGAGSHARHSMHQKALYLCSSQRNHKVRLTAATKFELRPDESPQIDFLDNRTVLGKAMRLTQAPPLSYA